MPDSTTAAGRAVDLLREKNDVESVAAALWIAGTFHLHRYEHVEAQPALDEAIEKAAEAGDSLVLGRALEAAAEIAFRMHDYSTTLAHARRALAVWEEQQDLTRKAIALTWVGSALMQMSCYQEAFEKLYAALELFQQIGKQHLSGRALNYIAIMHEELGDFEQAFRFYDRSLEMIRLQGDAGHGGPCPGECRRSLRNPEAERTGLELPQPGVKHPTAAWVRTLFTGGAVSQWLDCR